jgi:hypothetical protein
MENSTIQVRIMKDAVNHGQSVGKNGKTDFIFIINNDTILSWDLAQVHKIEDPEVRQKLQATKGMDDKCRRMESQENRLQILTEYQDANLNRRLQMYLQFPKLKSDFESINTNDQQMKSSVEFQTLVKSFAAQMGMALGSSAMGHWR